MTPMVFRHESSEFNINQYHSISYYSSLGNTNFILAIGSDFKFAMVAF